MLGGLPVAPRGSALPVNGRRSTRFSGRAEPRLEPRKSQREFTAGTNTAGTEGAPGNECLNHQYAALPVPR
jgi:hypothetical protein